MGPEKLALKYRWLQVAFKTDLLYVRGLINELESFLDFFG